MRLLVSPIYKLYIYVERITLKHNFKVNLALRFFFSQHQGMLLNILNGFTYNIVTSGIIFFFLALLSLAIIIAFSGLELAIAFIQAQVKHIKKNIKKTYKKHIKKHIKNYMYRRNIIVPIYIFYYIKKYI